MDHGNFPPIAPMPFELLEADGVPTSHMYMVAGRADTQPLFPDDPYIAANRHVTITLMREEPPIPPNFKP
jgi:chemotaxis protein MotB